MENEEKIIWITHPALSEKEVLNKFHSYFNISGNMRWLFDRVPISSGYIWYTCPSCAAKIKAEWSFVESDIQDHTVGKGEVYSPAHRATVKCYKLYFGGRIERVLENFTDQNYEEYQKIRKKVKDSLGNHNKEIFSEIKYAAELSHCPICNSPLIKKPPYIYCRANVFEFPKSMESCFDWADGLHYGRGKHIYESSDSNELAKAFEIPALENHTQYMQACDITIPVKSYNKNISASFLKEYVLNLINMESNILSMSKRLKELYLFQGQKQRDLNFEQNYTLYNLSQEIVQKNNSLLKSRKRLTDLETKSPSYITVEPPPKPTEPVPRKANIFNKKKVELLNTNAEEKFRLAMQNYNAEVENCKVQTENNRMKAENRRHIDLQELNDKIKRDENELTTMQNTFAEGKANITGIVTKSFGAKHIIDTEIASLEEALKNTFKCRNELYSYNVIFEKYRDIVALSTFYEYLMSGRCESLEGVNGAYNIYENELRLNMIITKLDEIKENQYMIYNKLNSIETSLNSLNRTMEKAVSTLDSINANTSTMSEYLENISKNTDVIAHNSAVTAYYSKVNAELTNALGFIVAMN